MLSAQDPAIVWSGCDSPRGEVCANGADHANAFQYTVRTQRGHLLSVAWRLFSSKLLPTRVNLAATDEKAFVGAFGGVRADDWLVTAAGELISYVGNGSKTVATRIGSYRFTEVDDVADDTLTVVVAPVDSGARLP